MVHLAIMQGHPTPTLIAINLPSSPPPLINDHEGDHATELPEAIQG